jgi:hypothetical protein
VGDSAVVDRPVPSWPAARPGTYYPGSAQRPVRTVIGEVADHLEVTGSVVVQGTVAAGATLGDGARLDVEGALDGPVRIGRSAVLTVHGTYSGDAVVNDGLVLVAGVATLDAVRRRRVAVAYGSMLRGAYGEAWTIDGNGRLRRLDGGTSLDIHIAAHLAANYCLWSEVAGAFLPVEELPPVS